MRNAFLSRPPATTTSVTGHRRLVRLQDRAGTEGGGLDQGAVNVLRSRRQRLADQQPGELVVDQHRPVAAVPVQRQQPVLAHLLVGGKLGEHVVDGHAALGGRRW
jgi:hypothetical protein